jgi:hypothetical protein
MENTKPLYESPKKSENNEKYGEFGSECICCGRPMAAGPCKWVQMNTNWEAVKPSVPESDFDSQGSFPIGNECAKKMKGFTFEGELEKSHPHLKK